MGPEDAPSSNRQLMVATSSSLKSHEDVAEMGRGKASGLGPAAGLKQDGDAEPIETALKNGGA